MYAVCFYRDGQPEILFLSPIWEEVEEVTYLKNMHIRWLE